MWSIASGRFGPLMKLNRTVNSTNSISVNFKAFESRLLMISKTLTSSPNQDAPLGGRSRRERRSMPLVEAPCASFE